MSNFVRNDDPTDPTQAGQGKQSATGVHLSSRIKFAAVHLLTLPLLQCLALAAARRAASPTKSSITGAIHLFRTGQLQRGLQDAWATLHTGADN